MHDMRSVIELMMDLTDQKKRILVPAFPWFPSDLHRKKVTGGLGNLRQHLRKTGSTDVV
jgi:hypothetical protein